MEVVMKTKTENPATVLSAWTCLLGVILMVALLVPTVAFSQATAPPLGTAADFGILAQAAISGTSVVKGNVGTLSGTIDGTITAPGYIVYAVNDAVVQTAIGDLLIAYNNATGQTSGATTLDGGILTGTLSPGIYVLSAATPNLATTVTLDGGGNANAIFLFKASSTLITATSSSVILTNGTVWSNVFWQVVSSATLGDGSTFEGTILANTSITVGTSATVTGRMLAGAVTATGAVTIASDVLPVELVSFTATANRMNAILHWSTATEVDNEGFEIERRQTGDWEKVGFVPGAGTSSWPQVYSYTDNNLSPGRYVYRIKQIDRGGSFKYFGYGEVEIAVPAKCVLEPNFPNPFNPSTTFSFSLPANSLVTLKVYDALGREVSAVLSEELPAGQYSRQWNAAALPSGVYFYRLVVNATSLGQADSYTATKKLLLLR
jgi:cytoskeletal protein CcmA (bactofilin family)